LKPILEIHNVSKRFSISSQQQPYLNFRDIISGYFRGKEKTEDFWALRNVSFEVETGDTIGIIGKNGAGKSTLLKILSKITPPTEGKIIGRGRIASLLEVGTGFHSELSGRENVFMNGSILGMRKSEIQKNFDAIVDFAGVEKFINTPLKHYSSGMQLRLAFAVAAFLENEILIIDEVLAVGDAEFQKKCIGKMESVSKSGRTILFVSHNTASLNRLCHKGVYLKNGQVSSMGSMSTVINEYLKEKAYSKITYEWNPNGSAKLTHAHLINEEGNTISSIDFGKKIFLILKINNGLNRLENIELGIAINTQYGIRLLINTFELKSIPEGNTEIKIEIPSDLFCPGFFDFDFSIQDGKKNMLDYEGSFCEFEVLKDNTEFEYYHYDYGLVSKKMDWQIL
jgi:ABC-type polysaccharide/polyol phosphate transport system ATPase subunit